MKVVFLITATTGIMCGVGDYTQKLAQEITRQGVEASVEIYSAGALTSLRRLKRAYNDASDVIIHVQYPTTGMGKSPLLALLPLLFRKHKTFITLHEFEQFHIVRKCYILLFQFMAKNIIFTNEWEYCHYSRYYPWAKKKKIIIPIGNNIDVVPPETETEKTLRLINFGQIAPGKGLEQFIETVKLLRRKRNAMKCAIIGAMIDSKSAIALQVLEAAKQYDIECLFDLPSREVSRELSLSSIAFLPFEGSVSDKRSSALACLKHGLSVLTHHGDETPAWWKETTYNASSPQEAVQLIESITAGKIDAVPNPKILSEAMAQRNWSHIAREHIRLYTGE